MPRNHWLVKQEPSAYSWDTFVREGGTEWTGVRNFAARNHLRAMKSGDLVLFYHSGDAKEVVGLARVEKEAYPDPTATEGDWSAVDLTPVKPLKSAVSLQTIKADPELKEMPILRQTRLSVTPVSAAQFKHILTLASTSAQT
ncbi:MAG: EVE domain-containing protein [Verrucomicrobiia bacterium]